MSSRMVGAGQWNEGGAGIRRIRKVDKWVDRLQGIT